jgi:putative membrane protein
MSIVASLLVAMVAGIHVWILVLEMALWQKPVGLRSFRLTPEQAAETATLAANQGLYNGFLAAGLVWGLVTDQRPVITFVLACVIVAGLFGGATVSKRIVLVQALPAAIALGAVLLAGS